MTNSQPDYCIDLNDCIADIASMPLSHCSDCRFYNPHPHHLGDIRCSLQPAYATMYERLKDLDSATLGSLPLDNCRDFALKVELEPLSLTLTLTRQQWQQLASQTSVAPAVTQIAQHLDLSPSWIEVDSSCLEAIQYDVLHSILQVRFRSTGQVYQYFDVPSATFNQLLDASSLGRFFTRYIKDIYDFESLS
ncbi:MAG TPA: KTSC domain-containing protein [Xenococcaceae cyanobacterium]|jgi:hypothetical protein